MKFKSITLGLCVDLKKGILSLRKTKGIKRTYHFNQLNVTDINDQTNVIKKRCPIHAAVSGLNIYG